MEPTLFNIGEQLTGFPRDIADSEITDNASQNTFENPHGNQSLASIRLKSELAAARLLAEPKLPAILLAKEWHVPHVAFGFEELPLYREIAEHSNCQIVEIARPEAGGMEHLIFMTRNPSLSYEELIACIDKPDDLADSDKKT